MLSCVCVGVCARACTNATEHTWRSKDNLWEEVLTFHYMGPRGHQAWQ